LKHWILGAAVLAAGLIFANSPAGAFPPAAPADPHAVRPVGSPHGPNPLNLTPAQQKKFAALQMKYQPQAIKAIRGAKTSADVRKRLAPLEKKMNTEVMAILTPAQQKKFRALRAEAAMRDKAAAAHAGVAPRK
jgi:hypothetical protein